MASPKHVGIIMDGNRRFAKSLKLSPWKGHEFGEKKVFELLEWCKEFKIKEVTVYAFSIQNLGRPKREFDYLMNIFLKGSEKMLNSDDFLKSGVKINVLGDISVFPEDVRLKLSKLIDVTKNNNKYILNIALGYGGREEIVMATKKIASKVKAGKISVDQIDESLISEHLYLSSEPDLIIRTGGDYRTSNFLPWQSIYSEWFFLDKKWPELSKKDFVECLEAFSCRKRTFGR